MSQKGKTSHLYFNVSWIINKLLNKKTVITKAWQGFLWRQFESFPENINKGRIKARLWVLMVKKGIHDMEFANLNPKVNVCLEYIKNPVVNDGI